MLPEQDRMHRADRHLSWVRYAGGNCAAHFLGPSSIAFQNRWWERISLCRAWLLPRYRLVEYNAIISSTKQLSRGRGLRKGPARPINADTHFATVALSAGGADTFAPLTSSAVLPSGQGDKRPWGFYWCSPPLAPGDSYISFPVPLVW